MAGAGASNLGVQIGVGRVAARAVVHVGLKVGEPLLDTWGFELGRGRGRWRRRIGSERRNRAECVSDNNRLESIRIAFI